MATLKDIAHKLGLSITQVSRALNDHSDVNEDTRRRVKQAAKSLQYQPNISARKLVSGRSGIVGLVTANVPKLSEDPLFLEVVAGLSEQFSSRGMQFVLHIAQPGENILHVYRKLVNSGALDGFVLVNTHDNDPRVAFLMEEGVPFVLHGRAGATPDYPFFDIDNERLSRDQAEFLVAHGHRDIALIHGFEGMAYTSARVAGYAAALRAAGITVNPDRIHHGRMDEAHGLLQTIRMFDGKSPGPTAIMCGNVLIARGVYRGLEALGLRIPQDVSVTAHDDLLPNLRASAFFPSLTVTKAPLRDSWLPLADFLAGALDGKPLTDLQRVADHEFIARNSVAQAPA